MRIYRHCCAVPDCKLKKEKLDYIAKLLDENKIKFSYEAPDYWLVFDIYEDNCCYEQIHKLLGEDSFSMTEAQYNKEELSDAQWLYMFSRCNKYYDTEEDIYLNDSCCKKGRQIKDVGLNTSKVNLGKNFLMSTADQSIEFIVSDLTKKILSDNGLKGINFRPVRKRKTSESFENCWQLCAETVNNCVDSSSMLVDEESVCKICGRQDYIPDVYKMMCIYENCIPKDIDMFFTGTITADDIGRISSYPIISKRFYQVLLNNKMLNNLVFEPIKLT